MHPPIHPTSLINLTDMSMQQLTDEDLPSTITQLQRSYFQNRDAVESQWNSTISELRRTQKDSFRDYVIACDMAQVIPQSDAAEPAPLSPTPQENASQVAVAPRAATKSQST